MLRSINKVVFGVIFLTFYSFANGQVGENNDAIGVQLAGNMLLFNNCCFESLNYSDPKFDMGYRIAVISRHTSGNRFYHDFQVSYSRERIGLTENRNSIIQSIYLDYEAYHLTYYFGIKPLESLPIKLFVGHNFGHIAHNFGDGVESELFGLNFKTEVTFELPYSIYIEPMIDFSWTYNKSVAYNYRIVFGFNCLKRI